MEVDFLCSVCRDRKGTFELLSISRTCKALGHSLARLLISLICVAPASSANYWRATSWRNVPAKAMPGGAGRFFISLDDSRARL